MEDTKPSTGLMIPGERERNTLTHQQRRRLLDGPRRPL